MKMLIVLAAVMFSSALLMPTASVATDLASVLI